MRQGAEARRSLVLALSAVLACLLAPPALAAPPETAVTSGPPEFSNDTSAQFTFTSNPAAGATFACRLNDQVGFSSCSTPHTINGLGEGEHVFRVKATQGGETDGTPAVHVWNVDLTPPDTTLTKQPDALTSSTTATFEFTSPSSEPVVFRCSLNGAIFEPCESPVAYSGLTDGTREFRVRARDRAGNVDLSPPTAGWTVDATPPDTTITQAPSGLSNKPTPVIVFEGEADATFQCSVNGAEFTACASPATLEAGLRQGENAVRVRAVDAAGNADPSPARAAWVLDTVAPEAPDVTVFVAGPAPPRATPAQFEPLQKPVATLKPFDRPRIAGTPYYLLDRRLQVAWEANGVADGIKFDVSVSESTVVPFFSSFNPGPLKPLLSATTDTKAIFVAKPGLYYCFEVAAVDAAGNWSPVSSACSHLPIRARDIPRGKKTSAPVRTAKKSYLGEYRLLKRGSLVLDAVAGVLLRRFSLVATTCPKCGKVVVTIAKNPGIPNICHYSWCGGRALAFGAAVQPPKSTTVNLKSSKTKRRQIVPVVVSTSKYEGSYTVTVKRSSGRPQIEGLAFSPNN